MKLSDLTAKPGAEGDAARSELDRAVRETDERHQDAMHRQMVDDAESLRRQRELADLSMQPMRDLLRLQHDILEELKANGRLLAEIVQLLRAQGPTSQP